jgi:dienelactone hydrolase
MLFVAFLAALTLQAAELPELQKPPANLSAAARQLPPLLPPDADRDTWQARRAELQRAWTQFLGRLPQTKCPLEVQFEAVETLPALTRQRLTFQVEPGVRTDAMLLAPRERSGTRLPGLVFFHPTYTNHYRRAVGLEGLDEPERHQAVQWAERGYIVLAPRCYLWAEPPPGSTARASGSYVANVHRELERHPDWKGITRMLWDGIRALDVLETLPGVDRERLGVFGHSLGAKEVLYVAAFDTRVRCAVSSEGGIGMKQSNWHDVWYLGPEIRQPGFPREHHELLALIAPRPFLLLAGGASDNDASWAFIEAALSVYRLLGAPQHLGWFHHSLGHRYGAEARTVAENFMDAHLKRNPSPSR